MYTLYYLPGACSLATQVILRELGQPVDLQHRDTTNDFNCLNPVGSVPVLKSDQAIVREGAAILLHLLDSHPNQLLPAEGPARTRAIQHMMFANATMHPAYGRLFFLQQHLPEGETRAQLMQAAANDINRLWSVVEADLAEQPFLGGEHHGPADVLLGIYSRWGDMFPASITPGPRTQGMISRILALPSFRQSLAAEQAQAEMA